MSDKMTIEKAREITRRPRFDVTTGEVEILKLYSAQEHNFAVAFIEGYESRQAEVEELKKKIDALLYWQERGESNGIN